MARAKKNAVPVTETAPDAAAAATGEETAPFLAFEHVYERIGNGNHARRVTRDREPLAAPAEHRFAQTYVLKFETAAERDAALC